MNIIRRLYLKKIRYKLYKPFKPLGLKKKENFLISAPIQIKDFLKALPFLGGIRKLGNVILLVPQSFTPFIKMLRAKLFNCVCWSESPTIFTREFDLLKKELNNYECSWLIELNQHANLALPILINAERRVAFYDLKNFPYYNILVKDGIESLFNFFQISAIDPAALFKFNKLELKSIAKNLPGERPYLFVNKSKKESSKLEELQWKGGLIFVDKSAEDSEELCKKLYLCDAYYGPDDEFCELARIFKKEIIVI